MVWALDAAAWAKGFAVPRTWTRRRAVLGEAAPLSGAGGISFVELVPQEKASAESAETTIKGRYLIGSVRPSCPVKTRAPTT